MSSGFVPAGTSADDNASSREPTAQDEAWLAAQKQIDASRQAERAALGKGTQEGGKTLFDVLQANKAAKQEAFEEATRLRNQFRSLDEDEVEFLDSVLESTRNREAEVKRETKERLDAFRRRQEEMEKAGVKNGDGDPEEAVVPVPTESWAVGPRKRKKGKEDRPLGVLKIRKASSSEKGSERPPINPPTALQTGVDTTGSPLENTISREPEVKAAEEKPSSQDAGRSQAVEKSPSPTGAPALGLGAYSSDEDE